MLLRPLRVILDEDAQRGEAKQEGLDEPQEAGAAIGDAFLAVGGHRTIIVNFYFRAAFVSLNTESLKPQIGLLCTGEEE